jgi:AP-1 complex subunit beta-1
MLTEDIDQASQIILCEKPEISEDVGNLDPQLLDRLLGNISMLSSVYYKPPEAFVKKIRDRINERLDLETDDIQLNPE